MHGSVRTEASLICAFARGTLSCTDQQMLGQPDLAQCIDAGTAHEVCAYIIPPHQHYDRSPLGPTCLHQAQALWRSEGCLLGAHGHTLPQTW